MSKSVSERVQAFRARKAQEGMSEVRGIYLPAALHQALKDHARELLRKQNNPTNGLAKGIDRE